jgi:hypothetical protein
VKGFLFREKIRLPRADQIVSRNGCRFSARQTREIDIDFVSEKRAAFRPILRVAGVVDLVRREPDRRLVTLPLFVPLFLNFLVVLDLPELCSSDHFFIASMLMPKNNYFSRETRQRR